MRLSEDWASRICRLVLTLMLVLGWTGGPVLAAAAQSGPGAADAPDPEKTLALLGRLDEMGRKALSDPRANIDDISAQAAQLGHDPNRIFAFVRDQITYEPYVGVLRGAQGALTARSANSADKSLLLKAMLESGGQTCRLVTGTLSNDQAGALVKQFLAADPLKGPLGELLAGTSDPDILATFCKETGLDPAKMSKVASDLQGHAEALNQYADAQTASTTDYLQAQLLQNHVPIGQSAAQWIQDLTARCVHHVWVQFQDSSGKWIDLDPSFSDSQFGQSRGANPAVVPNALPDQYQVTFTLVYAYTAADGTNKEEPILTVPLNVSECLFSPADFRISPADTLPSADALLSMSAEQRVKLLAGVKKFQALLRSGGRQFGSRAFDLKGNLFDISSDGRIEGAKQMGGAVGGMFGGALGGGAPSADKQAFRSLSMSISFNVPSGQPPIPPQHRVLLTAADLKGEHILSPMLDWEILIQPQVISAALSEVGTLRHLMKGIEPVLSMNKSGRYDPAALAGSQPEPYPMMLTQWSMFREAALARALKDSPAGAVLWDSPQVVVAERRFCMNVTSGHTCDRSRIDIIHNGLSIVPRDAAHEASAAALALRQGVFDTVAEGVLLKDAFPDSILTTAIGTLDSAKAAGAKLACYTGKDVAGAPLSASDQAIIQSSEPERKVLVPSTSGPASAWWSIDPRTGSAVGRAHGGYGGALVEDSIMQQVPAAIACLFSSAMDLTHAKTSRDKAAGILSLTVCVVGSLGGVIGNAMKANKFLGYLAWISSAISIGITAYKG